MGLKEKGWPKTKFEGESKKGGDTPEIGGTTPVFQLGLRQLDGARPKTRFANLFRVLILCFRTKGLRRLERRRPLHRLLHLSHSPAKAIDTLPPRLATGRHLRFFLSMVTRAVVIQGNDFVLTHF